VPPFRHSERSEESQLKNMRSFGLRPQDDKKRLNDKHQKKATLFVILSVAKNLFFLSLSHLLTYSLSLKHKILHFVQDDREFPNDVILSVSEESLPLCLYVVILSVAKNLIFCFHQTLKEEILRPTASG
jgi:hypothetical protein